jgi:hypothetical protein
MKISPMAAGFLSSKHASCLPSLSWNPQGTAVRIIWKRKKEIIIYK